MTFVRIHDVRMGECRLHRTRRRLDSTHLLADIPADRNRHHDQLRALPRPKHVPELAVLRGDRVDLLEMDHLLGWGWHRALKSCDLVSHERGGSLEVVEGERAGDGEGKAAGK